MKYTLENDLLKEKNHDSKPEQQYELCIKDVRYFTYISVIVVTFVGHHYHWASKKCILTFQIQALKKS